MKFHSKINYLLNHVSLCFRKYLNIYYKANFKTKIYLNLYIISFNYNNRKN